MNIKNLDKEKKKEILTEFYNNFENGFEFEEFLKPFLEKMGLEEVRVTKKTNDGGVDLECVRYGIVETSGDSVKYKVQAKRYKPSKPVQVEVVDRHRGIMKNGERGIIITTGKFSKPAIRSAISEIERPILLIDGEALIDICIEKNIGFTYEPIFDKSELLKFYKQEYATVEENVNMIVSNIEKDITANDIRARIISIPRTILDILPPDEEIFNLNFNGNEINNVKISSDRRFFSKGLSDMYRQYGLLTEDGEYHPARAIWSCDGSCIYVELKK